MRLGCYPFQTGSTQNHPFQTGNTQDRPFQTGDTQDRPFQKGGGGGGGGSDRQGAGAGGPGGAMRFRFATTPPRFALVSLRFALRFDAYLCAIVSHGLGARFRAPDARHQFLT